MATYHIEYEVKGYAPFPFDMLRYDASYPARPEDASLLVNVNDLPRQREVVTVRLVHTHPSKAWQPTVGRWESFGWQVGDWQVAGSWA
jgi:hypothetical protein